MHKQMSNFMETYLSPYLCGYRKGYSSQHALVALLEKWKISLDNDGYAGAILMDLSKAFDTLNHELLLAKLNAYGFDYNAISLIKSYLSDRWQRTKVKGTFSSWSELLQGVPRGSILGPLLFNIYINDLFFLAIEADLCNFADDSTFHVCDMELKSLLEKLESSSEKVIEWFYYNYMKLNQTKCHLLVSGIKNEVAIAKIGEATLIETHKVTLLGTQIDRKLSFDDHVNSIYKKAGRKLNALVRQCKVLPFHRRRFIMKAFIESQFPYCPLVWMFHFREWNYKINKLHYRALKIVYRDYTSSFDDLLIKDKSMKIHHKNIHVLAIEMFKVLKGISPKFMKNIFIDRSIPTDSMVGALRSQNTFYNLHNTKSVHYGMETLSSIGPKIWDIIPLKIKESSNLLEFKHLIKGWVPEGCPCRLCKTYIKGFGFYKVICLLSVHA